MKTLNFGGEKHELYTLEETREMQINAEIKSRKVLLARYKKSNNFFAAEVEKNAISDLKRNLQVKD